MKALREALSLKTVVALMGAVLLTAGVAMAWPPGGLIVSGLLLLSAAVFGAARRT